MNLPAFIAPINRINTELDLKPIRTSTPSLNFNGAISQMSKISLLDDQNLKMKLCQTRDMIKEELTRAQNAQNLNASPMTIRNEMGFV